MHVAVLTHAFYMTDILTIFFRDHTSLSFLGLIRNLASRISEWEVRDFLDSSNHVAEKIRLIDGVSR